MNSFLSLVLAYCMLILESQTCLAQSDNTILAMDVSTEPVSYNFSSDSLPVLTDSTVFEVMMNVNLYDTTNIEEIEVKIGTSDGASDLVNQTFTFDVFGSLGGGLSYDRLAYNLSLGLGQHSGMLNYFASVRVKRTDNSWSSSIVYNR